jgi:hypothetical protein
LTTLSLAEVTKPKQAGPMKGRENLNESKGQREQTAAYYIHLYVPCGRGGQLLDYIVRFLPMIVRFLQLLDYSAILAHDHVFVFFKAFYTSTNYSLLLAIVIMG